MIQAAAGHAGQPRPQPQQQQQPQQPQQQQQPRMNQRTPAATPPSADGCAVGPLSAVRGGTVAGNGGNTNQENSGSFTFDVVLQKTDGARLGIDVLRNTVTDHGGLIVKRIIKGGIVDLWNESNPDSPSIRADDCIIAVNGVTADFQKMMEELRAKIELRTTVLRRGSIPNATSAAPATEPNVPGDGIVTGAPSPPGAPPQVAPAISQGPAPKAEAMGPQSQRQAAPCASPNPNAGPETGIGMSPPEASQPMLRFDVELDKKSDRRFGIDVMLVTGSTVCGLVVERVLNGGCLDLWNQRSRPPYRVQAGDYIVQVNGLANWHSFARMADEFCRDRRQVRFTVQRGPLSLPRQPNSGTADAPQVAMPLPGTRENPEAQATATVTSGEDALHAQRCAAFAPPVKSGQPPAQIVAAFGGTIPGVASQPVDAATVHPGGVVPASVDRTWAPVQAMQAKSQATTPTENPVPLQPDKAQAEQPWAGASTACAMDNAKVPFLQPEAPDHHSDGEQNLAPFLEPEGSSESHSDHGGEAENEEEVNDDGDQEVDKGENTDMPLTVDTAVSPESQLSPGLDADDLATTGIPPLGTASPGPDTWNPLLNCDPPFNSPSELDEPFVMDGPRVNRGRASCAPVAPIGAGRATTQSSGACATSTYEAAPGEGLSHAGRHLGELRASSARVAAVNMQGGIASRAPGAPGLALGTHVDKGSDSLLAADSSIDPCQDDPEETEHQR